MKKRYSIWALAFLLTASCTQQTQQSSLPTVSGVVQLGRVSNATVTIYQVENGARGTQLAQTRTDANGAFSAQVKSQSKPVEVVASGGTYTDESTGNTVSLSASEELAALVANTATSKATPITPLTQQARDRVFAQIDSGSISQDQIVEAHEAALGEVAQVFGVTRDIVTAVPAHSNNPGDGLTDASKAAYLLATLSQFMKDQNLGPNKGVNPITVLKALSQDFKNDGKLNGQDQGESVDPNAKKLASAWSTGLVRAAKNLKNNPKATPFQSVDDATSLFSDFIPTPENLVQTVASQKNTMVTICHLPNGNPLNRVSQQVAQSSVASHLGHGDSLGTCTNWNSTTTSSAPSARYGHTAIWTGSKMIIWGGYSQFEPYYNSVGGMYDPKTDSWTAMSSVNAPAGRVGHTAVWTGDRMIIFGGWSGSWFSDGASFDPETNTWTPISDSGLGRAFHTAVFTGSKMIVWGGEITNNVEITQGALYDIDTDTWSALPSTNEPVARAYHTAVWTGGKMIVFGGYDNDSNRLNSGGVFNLDTGSWTSTNLTNAPEARSGHTAVWTGGRMIVWGGWQPGQINNAGGIYNPRTDTWSSISLQDAPEARSSHTAVWTGDRMIVWGGRAAQTGSAVYLSSGGSFDPVTNTWTALPSTGAPTGRQSFTSVWTGSQMIVFGGYRSAWLNSGGIFSP